MVNNATFVVALSSGTGGTERPEHNRRHHQGKGCQVSLARYCVQRWDSLHPVRLLLQLLRVGNSMRSTQESRGG